MPRIVDNNISDLILTVYRHLMCWILIARHLNINKNIPHSPEVHIIGAPKSHKCDCVTLVALACLNEVYYLLEMLRTRQKVVVGFVLNWIHFVAPIRRKRVYKKSFPWSHKHKMKSFKWLIIVRVELYIQVF